MNSFSNRFKNFHSTISWALLKKTNFRENFKTQILFLIFKTWKEDPWGDFFFFSIKNLFHFFRIIFCNIFFVYFGISFVVVYDILNSLFVLSCHLFFLWCVLHWKCTETDNRLWHWHIAGAKIFPRNSSNSSKTVGTVSHCKYIQTDRQTSV